MGKGSHKPKKGAKHRLPQDQTGKTSKDGPAPDRDEKTAPRKPRLGSKRPILRFVVIFGVCMGAFYALTSTSVFERRGWVPYLGFNARVSGAILELFGQDVTVVGRLINSPRASLSIERGCDAIHPSALFISAVIASPTLLWTRLCGVAVGTLFLMATNLVRIVSLFYVRLYFPNAFKIMHVEVWQALFIFLAILCWVIWARWAVRRKGGQPDAST